MLVVKFFQTDGLRDSGFMVSFVSMMISVSDLPRMGFLVPDYNGRNILNLLADIIRAAGGPAKHHSLVGGVSATHLRTVRHIVYLVVDGLGVEQLRRFTAAGYGDRFLARHPYDVLHTVCPATTAAAVTTFGTGLSPAEHGILGWHLHLADLGMVATILPTVTRTGVPMTPSDFDLRAYLDIPSAMSGVKRRRVLLSYAHIPRSRYSMAVGTWDLRLGYQTLNGMVRQLSGVLRGRSPTVVYAYWPGYDSHCHEYGCDHRRTVAHLREIDHALGDLASRATGSEAVVFVTADHGLVDTPNTVDLGRVPGINGCLAILPSGDARQVHCFVRPARLAQFERIVQNHLSHACVMIEGSEMLAKRLFGPGQPHPALARRVGDRVLLARTGWAFGYTPSGSKSDFNQANHGGLSPEEVRVPLYTICG